jgi:SAM-dependent methyltransferase
MRKFYQTEWHGIPFKSFTEVSSTRLADAQFYAAFYDAFFQRYNGWDDLNPDWVALKQQSAQFLMSRIKNSKQHRILSIGCGLGVIEKGLLEAGYSQLEVTEISASPLRWIEAELPKAQIHIGEFPDCVPENRTYDLIYLPGVEYIFDLPQLIGFLKRVKGRLAPGGACLLLSWSFEFPSGFRQNAVFLKDAANSVLETLGIRHRGQFWGYTRNRQDFRRAVSAAEFTHIADGVLDKTTRWDTYWIEGRNNQ